MGTTNLPKTMYHKQSIYNILIIGVNITAKSIDVNCNWYCKLKIIGIDEIYITKVLYLYFPKSKMIRYIT
jgi:hypothetical protein